MHNTDLLITLLTFVVASFLLVTNYVKGDQVALLIILVLMTTGVLSIPEALSGFSNPVVVIITAMFIISEAVVFTGIAQRLGEKIIEHGGTNEAKLMTLLMAASCFVGSFMSSTATVAIFVPVAIAVAHKAHLNHRRLLMPLAVGSLISGMMTLVATSPNIVVNNALSAQGLEKLSFFSFTPIGVSVLIVSIFFMIVIGRRLLDKKMHVPQKIDGRTISDLIQHYKMQQDIYLLMVPPDSKMADRAFIRLQLRKNYHVKMIGLQTFVKGRREISVVRPETVIKAGDVLVIVSRPEHIDKFISAFKLQRKAITTDGETLKAFFQVIGAAEVMLTPDSNLIGKSVKEISFQTLFRCMVLGIRRRGETITENITDLPLQFGDVLLVSGAWVDILKLKDFRDQYLLLTIPHDLREVVPGGNKATLAVGVLLVMVLLMVFNILPNVIAILGAAAALIFFRCVNMDTYYKTIDWKTVFLIAGILPLALALQKTGASTLVSNFMLQTFGGVHSLVVLAGIFLVTVFTGLFISNTPAAVLVAPVAVDIGVKLNISPQACAMIVAIACSAAFISPVGSAVNMVVREPGGYRFRDYMKIGIPLLLFSMCISITLVWLLYLN
ncbi:SLC13 family permease [Desulfopila sp. IMCC35008]|uniref:SLC13 family permease n=1 Tax=Desulfopila sp. IMCC35008 TaxID=2653858 RepID=UPI0013D2A372|nr:SLC13 family permease [Desulfopila sp. IMCC35008]